MAEGKKILLTITGTQYPPGCATRDEEDTAVVTVTTAWALYYEREGEHYLFYEEQIEGCPEPVKTRIRFRQGYLEMNRRGIYGCRMTFEEGCVHSTLYPTPYGKLLLDVVTENVLLDRAPDGVERICPCVEARYQLQNEGQPIGDYRLRLESGEKSSDTDE